jgi:Acetyltransferase (GNAT) domain
MICVCTIEYTKMAMQEYVRFCAAQAYVPLHLQPWWLEAVSGDGTWGCAISADGEGVAGILPWYKTHKWGMVPLITNPPLTSYAGPWLRYPNHQEFKTHSRYTYEKKHLTALAQQLPQGVYRQTWRPEVTNWMPFSWLGYRQTTRYTYILDTHLPLQVLEAGLKSSVRGYLSKSTDDIYCTTTDDTGLVYGIYQRSLARKKVHVAHRLAHFERLHAALAARGQVQCWLATERTGEPVAALCLVYDAQQAGLLLSGADPRYQTRGAIQRLIWEAIRFSHQNGLVLDFEGSMDAQVEHTFRAFGGVMVPYFGLKKP